MHDGRWWADERATLKSGAKCCFLQRSVQTLRWTSIPFCTQTGLQKKLKSLAEFISECNCTVSPAVFTFWHLSQSLFSCLRQTSLAVFTVQSEPRQYFSQRSLQSLRLTVMTCTLHVSLFPFTSQSKWQLTFVLKSGTDGSCRIRFSHSLGAASNKVLVFLRAHRGSLLFLKKPVRQVTPSLPTPLLQATGHCRVSPGGQAPRQGSWWV